jgi:hypothetical protein
MPVANYLSSWNKSSFTMEIQFYRAVNLLLYQLQIITLHMLVKLFY